MRKGVFGGGRKKINTPVHNDPTGITGTTSQTQRPVIGFYSSTLASIVLFWEIVYN